LIFNEAGELVRSLSNSLALYQMPQGLQALEPAFAPEQGSLGLLLLSGTGVTLAWDGLSNAGQLVDAGHYMVHLEVKDAFGKVSSWPATLMVLRDAAQNRVEIFNSAGELVWSHSLTTGSPSGLSLSETHFVPSQAALSIKYGSSSADVVLWDGKNNAGQAVAQGSYTVKVTQSGAGVHSSYAKDVVVLDAGEEIFASVEAGPNPAGKADAKIEFFFKGLAPGSLLFGQVFNVAGEKVSDLAVTATGLLWALNGSEASGIYLARVQAQGALGHAKSQTIKLVLIK